ncbi:unnamed protein product [Amaranthus hypochondriacus]
MDSQLSNRNLNFTCKKKKWVLLLAAFGLTGYGVFRVYDSPTFDRKRKRLFTFYKAFVSILESISVSAETICFVSKDLREFLQSDSDEIPNSLKQISKVSQSKEFLDSVIRVTSAITKGVFMGYQGVNSRAGSDSGFYDRFMDKLLSDSGSGFASVVVGSFARNLVLALYSNREYNCGLNSGAQMNGDGSMSSETDLPRWVNAMCSDPFKDLVLDCIQKFVSTAVAVYLDKTINVNTYDELFAGLTNPKHNKQVRDLLVSLCNGSIETLVKTSHQVLTDSNSDENMGSDSSRVSGFVVRRSNSDVVPKTLSSVIDGVHNVITIKQHGDGGRGLFGLGESKQEFGGSWMSTMSSTLAIPTNRKLVLDVTGRVTFETVRSFLEFLLGKLFASVKRSVRYVTDAVIDTGRHVVRYVTAKSYVVGSICLSLCLHVMGSPLELMPA